MRFDLRDAEPVLRPMLSMPETQWGRDRFVAAVSDEIGVARRTVHRWLAEGMSANQADRLAVAFGLHPASLWPDWFAGIEVAAA